MELFQSSASPKIMVLMAWSLVGFDVEAKSVTAEDIVCKFWQNRITQPFS